MQPSQQYVLSLVLLLLATFKSTFGICSLCSDGSTVTNPDYFIGWKELIVVNTCKDLSDIVLFLEIDSDECREVRLWSTICGCPVAKNSYSICEGSQNITKPQQLLGGLVDFTEVESFDFDLLSANGIAFTCALQEFLMQKTKMDRLCVWNKRLMISAAIV